MWHDILCGAIYSAYIMEPVGLPENDDGASPQLEFERWSHEIRRGAISLAILAVISMGESYGYNIMQKLEEFSSLQIEPSTTYPLLRRLEKRGILEGNWVTEGGRRRRLYYVTKEGKRTLEEMVDSWRDLNNQLVELLKEGGLL